MNLKSIFLLSLVFLFTLSLVSSIETTFQGDLNLKDRYNIFNAINGSFVNISAQYYCNSTSCYQLSDFLAAGVGGADNASWNESYANTLYADISVVDTQKSAGGDYLYNDSNSIYLNDTVLNATIDNRDSDTTYSAGSGLSLATTTFSVAFSDTFLGWDNLTAYPTACASNQYVSTFADILICSAISIPVSQISDFTSSVNSLITGYHDQVVNTTSNVTFNQLNISNIFSDDWTNITLTSSQVSDFTSSALSIMGGYHDQDLNTTNSVNFDNVTLTKALKLGNLTFTNITSNEYIDGDIYAFKLDGQVEGDGNPHVYFHEGGASQFNGLVRSWGIINEDTAFLNNSNLTDCQAYFDSIGDTLKIDCNTSATGADLFVSDDLQVVGDVYLKDTAGDYHFMTRTLDLIDGLFSNLMLNNVNATLDGTNLSFVDANNALLAVNLDANESIFTRDNDWVSLSAGTNTSPTRNYVYYEDSFNPTLTSSTSQPSGNIAEVARVIQGDGYTYASVVDKQSQDQALRSIFLRFNDQGPLYVSGYTPDINSTHINFSSGSMTVITHRHSTTKTHDTDDSFFYVNSTGHYIQLSGLDDIDTYSDGTSISNNKYFSVVLGISHSELGGNKMIALIQSGTTEYTSLINAEDDSSDLTVYFPSDSILRSQYLPVVRVIMQRTSNVNNVQLLTKGDYYFDLRGVTTSAGGAAATPPITDHGLLDGLTDDDHTQYLLANGSRTLTGDWNAGSYNITTLYIKGNGSELTGIPVIGDCPTGQFVQNLTTGGVECAAAAGSGDITSVTGNDTYILDHGTGASGDVNLSLNETKLNESIDARAGNGGNTSWNESLADTLYYAISNPFSFWNDTYATFNKTFADTLYADISVVDTDTQKGTTGPYLYNDSTNIILNDTYLNATIDNRDADTTYSAGGGLNLVTETFSVAFGTSFLGWTNLTSYPTTCSSSQYISSFGDTLGCTAISILESQISDLSHTVDTNASTACTGTQTYLDGENNCDTLDALTDFTDDLGHTQDNESWNETWANTQFVNIDGDTMEGNLNITNYNVTSDHATANIRFNGTCWIMDGDTSTLEIC